MLVTVSAELPIDARAYVLERDGAAFRSYMCEVSWCPEQGDGSTGLSRRRSLRRSLRLRAAAPSLCALLPITLAPNEQEMRLLEYEITACWQEGGAAEGAAPVTRIHLASKPDVSAWVPETLAGRVGEEFGYIDEARGQAGGRGCFGFDADAR